MRCDPCGGAVEDDDGHLKERGGGKVNRVKRRLCQEAENELQNGKNWKVAHSKIRQWTGWAIFQFFSILVPPWREAENLIRNNYADFWGFRKECGAVPAGGADCFPEPARSIYFPGWKSELPNVSITTLDRGGIKNFTFKVPFCWPLYFVQWEVAKFLGLKIAAPPCRLIEHEIGRGPLFGPRWAVQIFAFGMGGPLSSRTSLPHLLLLQNPIL